MRSVSRPWLPESALRSHALEARLSELVEQWSAKWFARDIFGMAPTGLARRAIGDTVDGCDWLTLGADLALTFTKDLRPQIARTMLDASAERGAPSDADTEILNGVADTCIDDLARRLTELFRLDANAPWQRRSAGHPGGRFEAAQSYTISSTSTDGRITLSVADDLLVGFMKGGAITATRNKPLGSLEAALACQIVAVMAIVGRSTVTLGEIRDLSEGDVIMLDRAIDAPLDVTLDRTPRTIGQCVIERSEHGFALKLIEPVKGDG